MAQLKFTERFDSELGGLSNLALLWLDGNSLTGSIPAEIGKLASLKDLNLSNNGLTGSIPGALGSLSSLVDLNLSRNELTGLVPSELGNLANLTQLWLDNTQSFNDLTGPVPTTFVSLSKLLELSVGFTYLCAPADPSFRHWLEAIPTLYGPLLPCTQPRLIAATPDGAELELEYYKDLDANSVPSPTDFQVSVEGVPRSVTGVSIVGTSVVLTLAPPMGE